MSASDGQLKAGLENGLAAYCEEGGLLPGLASSAARATFTKQLVASVHRVRYVRVLNSRPISPNCADPNHGAFDPLKAAILRQRAGDADDACWLVFLFVHFGKSPAVGWRYVREIYGRLGGSPPWNWAAVSSDPRGFRTWLHENIAGLTRSSVPRAFGNHRKYQSLDAYSAGGTGAAVESYVAWVNPPRTHTDLVQEAITAADDAPKRAFRMLNKSMRVVVGFGRTARFDYLAMLGKLGLAKIEPDSAYLAGSTGPCTGARLLLGGGVVIGTQELERRLARLDEHLHVGMQVLEDALCNWQKSPTIFRPFRG